MLKRILLIAGGLLVLLAVILTALVLLVDPNDYKDEIGAYASRMAGREVKIVDDMKLSVFPWLGVGFGRVVLANAPGFGPEPLAQVGKAQVHVRLLPLLSRRLEFDTIQVEDLEVSLARDRNGRANWEGIGGTHAAVPAAPRPAAEPALALPAALSIGGLDIRRGALHWHDASSGSAFDLTDITLRSGRITAGLPVGLDLRFQLHDPSAGLDGNVAASTRLTARPDGQRFEADDLKLEAQLEGARLPARPLAVSLAGRALVTLDDDKAEIPALAITALGIKLNASAKVDHLTTHPHVQGRLDAPPFDLRALLAAVGHKPETADAKALSSASLSLALDADGQGARLENVEAKLDDTTLRGRLTVSNFSAPAFGFDLALDRLDADRYLPRSAKASAAAVPAAPAAAALLPVETLRALALDGRLKAGLFKVAGLTLHDVSIAAKAGNGLVTLAPLSASLYGGRYSGATRIDARTETPALGFDLSLSAVQAEPLLEDLFDIDLFSGTADLGAKLTARGATEPELRRSLNGTADFSLRDGAIKGFNAAQLIRDAKTRLQGGAPAAGSARETDFTALSASLKIADGIARNDDLTGSSPYLRLGGSGEADLVRERIDYRLRARIVDTSAGQGGAGLDAVKGVDIPIRVSGALARPDIGLDSRAVADLLRDKATKELERKAKKELGNKLKDALKGLSR